MSQSLAVTSLFTSKSRFCPFSPENERHINTTNFGDIGDGFYGSNDPTNSLKAPKEDVQGLGFNSTRSTPLCYNNTTHMQ